MKNPSRKKFYIFISSVVKLMQIYVYNCARHTKFTRYTEVSKGIALMYFFRTLHTSAYFSLVYKDGVSNSGYILHTFSFTACYVFHRIKPHCTREISKKKNLFFVTDFPAWISSFSNSACI